MLALFTIPLWTKTTIRPNADPCGTPSIKTHPQTDPYGTPNIKITSHSEASRIEGPPNGQIPFYHGFASLVCECVCLSDEWNLVETGSSVKHHMSWRPDRGQATLESSSAYTEITHHLVINQV